MQYDKQNRKFARLSESNASLKKENAALLSSSNEIKEILNNTLHEVRRFSAQLTKFSERLAKKTEDQPNLSQTAQSIYYTAGMIASRLAYTDIELNPQALRTQSRIQSGIYKKFDKVRRILVEECRNKKIDIKLLGQSHATIEALPVFELLPFVIIDNAIKYSPKNQIINVYFEDGPRVTVSSFGHPVEEDELPRLFEKGFRGSGAALNGVPGEGLGLFLAKRVSEYHGIRIHAEIGDQMTYEINGVYYTDFRIILDF